LIKSEICSDRNPAYLIPKRDSRQDFPAASPKSLRGRYSSSDSWCSFLPDLIRKDL
jgi:hypothetical protein